MIPIAKPSLGEREAEAAANVIMSGWVTQGPKVAEFETAFSEYTGSPQSVAVSSCTTALHLALIESGVCPGDVVITVSHSFIATANAVRYCGAEPVFVDIDATTFNMCPSALRDFLQDKCERRADGVFYKDDDTYSEDERSPLSQVNKPLGRVAGVLAVHQMGLPCDLVAIKQIADCYDIPLIEDAACAIGSEYSLDNGFTWEKVGLPVGELACFSFHPRKIVTTGDGGMITCRSEIMANRFRKLRQHSMSTSDTVRHATEKVIFESYDEVGYNYRMSDIQAAVGCVQLQRLPEIVAERRNLAEMYRRKLEPISWIRPPLEPEYMHSNWQSYATTILSNAPCDRNEIMQRLLDKEVASKPGIMNAHEEAPYTGLGYSLPNSESARRTALLLPLFNGMTEKQVDYVVTCLMEIRG